MTRLRSLALILFAVLTITSLGAAQCAPSSTVPSVHICTPTDGSTVTSPFNLQAAAVGNNPIKTMKVYLDGTSVFTASAASINTNITAAAGTHRITVRAWDTAGNFFSQTINITVSGTTPPPPPSGGCSATTDHTVVICAPTDGSTVASPFQLTAAASSSTGVSAMRIYVDSTAYDTQNNVTSLNEPVTATAGAHKITVVAWDNSGVSFQSAVNITVSTSTGTTCTASTDHTVHICSPANASTVNSPVQVTAAANASNGVKSMKIYLDSVGVYTVNASSINTSLSMSVGSHHITVKAWDVANVAFSSAVSFTVQSGTSSGTLTISPSSTTVTENGTVQFNASSGNTAVSWSVDGQAGGSAATGTISTSGLYTAPATAGSHTIGATDSSSGQSATASVNVVAPTSSGGGQAVTTYNYDNLRTGANTSETKLTPTNVNGTTFGKLATWSVDGSVYAQPLYVPGVSIGTGTFNVLYVATENDSVYAFNADSPGSAALWKHSFLSSTATIGTGYTGGRTSIGGNVGITGTPVIDVNTNRMYVVVRTTENSANVQRIHAIDIRTGKDVTTPTVINACVSGSGDGSSNGALCFDPLTENQRPGLILSNGIVYVAFGSFGDHTPYHGWIFAYDASNLSQVGVYNATPDGDGGGFWMAGAAIAADSNGNIFAATGNAMPNATGLFNPPDDLPNGVMKLHIVGSSLALVDYFAPFNDKCLSADDLDLGSTGPLLLPDGVGGANYAVVGSKEGRIYLLNRDNLGKFNSGSDSQIPQWILINPTQCGQSGFDASSPMRIYGSAAYWNGNVYLGSVFGPLRQYSIANGHLTQTALGTFTYKGSGQSGRGPQPTVSANGGSNGIVWTAWNDYSTGQGWLHAYDASNISKLLFSSNYGTGASFTTPMVANGHVFVASKSSIYVYGLK